jgi:Family of unknown function (DUF5670)
MPDRDTSPAARPSDGTYSAKGRAPMVSGPWRSDALASTSGRPFMLYTLALVLLILWVLGLVTSFTAGGLLHILLVIAVVMLIFQLISGRRSL